MSARIHRIGILLSGRGSNFLAIADAIANGTLKDCEIVCVISNLADAPGLQAAKDRGLKSIAQISKGVPRAEHDARMAALLQEHRVDYVILAGYMRVLTPEFIRTFPQRILNIHPSLLPSFPGLHAQQQALEYGVKVAGCTVHFVDEEVDGGVIVMQSQVPVHDGDTAGDLAQRILVQEHRLYPEAIARVLSGRYEARGRRYEPRI